MADTTIEWTDNTWNPVRGCSRVSEGCRNCYAEHQAMRITYFDRGAGRPLGSGAYDGLVTMTSQGPKWTGAIRLVPDKLYEPLSWKRPRRIFVNSMSDLFHEGVPADYIAQVFAVMTCSPWHTYQVLTKRSTRMVQLLNCKEWGSLVMLHTARVFDAHKSATTPSLMTSKYNPPPNVQLGVSAEDQRAADVRVAELLLTPAAVRFVSGEPLLGPVSLHELQPPGMARNWIDALSPTTPGGARVDWVIVGGESGRGARLMKPDWARALRDECQAAGVPFFFKQWGGVDKKEAGRLLDGREWNEFPEVQHGGN